MILEYAQLLSTAHRVLDGKLCEFVKPDSKTQKIFLLEGETASLQSRVTPSGLILKKYFIDAPLCYNATHMNHPSAVWARETAANYLWLSNLFRECSTEYTHRYKKSHSTFEKHGRFFIIPPKNIAIAARTKFPQAMPDEFKDKDSIRAYQNYYLGPKAAFARWTNRIPPTWFSNSYKDYDVSHFTRTT